MPASQSHIPVLLNALLEALNIKPAGAYIDCTFGRGGHSQALLEKLSCQGSLFLLDQDPDAIAYAQARFAHDARVNIRHSNFACLDKLAKENNLYAQVDGIFFDLGVSSPQLDNARRGFSFSHCGPLDMRMNTTTGETAAQWLAGVSTSELAGVLKAYGEERYAKKIAGKIRQEQNHKPITSTRRLSEIVCACYPRNYRGIHPATRTFQAIRIAVNQELASLQQALQASFNLLNHGGRLAVISFHSLEDRIIKRFIKCSRQQQPLPKMPVMPKPADHLRMIGKMLKPSADEIALNPRARSACLRVAEKVMV